MRNFQIYGIVNHLRNHCIPFMTIQLYTKTCRHTAMCQPHVYISGTLTYCSDDIWIHDVLIY